MKAFVLIAHWGFQKESVMKNTEVKRKEVGREVSMVRVVTKGGFDYVKKELVGHFVRRGYVIAIG